MLDSVFILLANWSPIVIWILLTLFGIYYGFKEVEECREDISNVEKEKDSYKYIVARGNTNNAYRSIVSQVLFLLVASVSIYFKIIDPEDIQITIIRSLVIPGIFIIAEILIVMNLIEQRRTRKKIKAKILKNLLNKG